MQRHFEGEQCTLSLVTQRATTKQKKLYLEIPALQAFPFNYSMLQTESLTSGHISDNRSTTINPDADLLDKTIDLGFPPRTCTLFFFFSQQIEKKRQKMN